MNVMVRGDVMNKGESVLNGLMLNGGKFTMKNPRVSPQ